MKEDWNDMSREQQNDAWTRQLDRYEAERKTRDAGRAAGNQEHVRDLLADREPQYAQTVERAVRDLSPRTGRSR